jgi:hypothetical protein
VTPSMQVIQPSIPTHSSHPISRNPAYSLPYNTCTLISIPAHLHSNQRTIPPHPPPAIVPVPTSPKLVQLGTLSVNFLAIVHPANHSFHYNSSLHDKVQRHTNLTFDRPMKSSRHIFRTESGIANMICI